MRPDYRPRGAFGILPGGVLVEPTGFVKAHGTTPPKKKPGVSWPDTEEEARKRGLTWIPGRKKKPKKPTPPNPVKD